MKALVPIERSPKSRREIERLVLHELQTAEGCEGATGISIIGLEHLPAAIPNWTVESFDPGASDGYDCERALINIVSRLQSFYELVQKH
jgi:hypothetical protein